MLPVALTGEIKGSEYRLAAFLLPGQPGKKLQEPGRKLP